ncbi:hypothetical protein [Marinomonas spartinae]|uniref:hypothetical protein n=1 Tax=Marinomonas spartinae TaxID=1792290 RepID=UPI0018F23D60|nr:hypothetical protein [Marinomonas spartinae]MBJ7554733.1 hypothetical protein [Marinomonas spartinae]
MEEVNFSVFVKLLRDVYEDPSLIEEKQESLVSMMDGMMASVPEGFEGMAAMIKTHISNAFKFKSPNVQKFELESGLIKLNTYCRKLGV